MSGRPKKGKKPRCGRSGPCLAHSVRRVAAVHRDSDVQCHNCAHTPVSLEGFVGQRGDRVAWPDSARPLLEYALIHSADNPFSRLETWCIVTIVDRYADFRIAPHLVISDAPTLDSDEITVFLAKTFQLAVTTADTYTEPYHLCLGDLAFCRRHANYCTRTAIAALCDSGEFREAEMLIANHEKRTGRRLRLARVFSNGRVRAYRAVRVPPT